MKQSKLMTLEECIQEVLSIYPQAVVENEDKTLYAVWSTCRNNPPRLKGWRGLLGLGNTKLEAWQDAVYRTRIQLNSF